jgi:phosphate transport system permease protein
MALANPAITRNAVERQLKGSGADIRGFIFRLLLLGALLISIGILFILLVDVWTGGWPVLSSRFGDFMTGVLGSRPERSGVWQGIRGSFWIGLFTIGLAFPLGIGAAIYLEEYAPHTRFARIVDVNIRNLAGVPSVVYGILGLAFIVRGIGVGRVVLAGGLILTLVVLPTVVVASREAIRSVPDSIRQGAFALGATKWQVVWRQVLPAAIPGMATGSILALSRAVGETAPLIMVGAITYVAFNPELFGPYTALPVQIYNWTRQPDAEFQTLAAAGAIVLLVIVLSMNAVAIFLRNRYRKQW